MNFYGFHKIRPDSAVLIEDEDMSASAVRFFHEYFQANRPDLLHKIQRATKSPDPSSPALDEHLQAEVEFLKDRLNSVTDEMDAKLAKLKTSLELDYRSRIANLEVAYKHLVASIVNERNMNPVAAPAAPSLATTMAGARDRFSYPHHHQSMNPLLALQAGNKLNSLGQEQLLRAMPNGFADMLRDIR
jgi:hypothetical protein